MSDAAISVRDVEKSYEQGRIRALRGMSMEVSEREWVAIVGPSGCGKSTLLHLIAALERPDAGHIHVHGNDLDQLRDAATYRRRAMGLVFQLHNLLPALSAAENVEVPMFGTGLRRSARRRRALELLDLIGLADRADARPTELSGGQRQRIAIARALANDPPILLADEPTGSLDSDAGRRVLELIQTLRMERDLTVVMVTHDMTVAGWANRTVHMLDGRVDGEEKLRPGERRGLKHASPSASPVQPTSSGLASGGQ
jgi:ABC-type lipoprotein export system ATPase subunit